DLGGRQPEPFGAQPHLRHRLLARNVNRAVAAARKRGRNLDQQRRLADAGVAAEQEHGAAHESAAGDAIELCQSRGEPWRLAVRPGQRLRRKETALAWHPALWRSGILFGNRVPLAAGVALALPAAVGGAAVLADEARFATGHDCAITCCTACAGS